MSDCEPSGQRFEGTSDLVDLDESVDRRLKDGCSAVRLQADDPIPSEFGKRLPDWCRADAEALDDFVLSQP